MIKHILYRYERDDGGINVSPNKPERKEYTTLLRLISEEGKALTNGNLTTLCVDVSDDSDWTEIDYNIEEV